MAYLRSSLLIGMICLVLAGRGASAAAAGAPSDTSGLTLGILSQQTLSGVAGDFVTVQGTISNTSVTSISGVTTYLSLVDADLNVPVDLEDWSAERGLYIGTIDTAQTLPLNWKIHFVKAGHYSLILVATRADRPVPQVSTITRFIVSPKRTLNPGQVLPVALGVPVFLSLVLVLVSYRRQRRSVTA